MNMAATVPPHMLFLEYVEALHVAFIAEFDVAIVRKRRCGLQAGTGV